MCWSTESWRQVYLPWLRATEQKLMICSRVPRFEQRGHVDILLLPHLLRLSGEGREFVDNLSANAMIPRGMPLIMDCQVTLCSSSISSFVKSPCIVRVPTLEFQRSKTYWLIDSFVAFFDFQIWSLLADSRLNEFSIVGTKNLSLLTLSWKIWSQWLIVDDLFVHWDSLSSLESRARFTVESAFILINA